MKTMKTRGRKQNARQTRRRRFNAILKHMRGGNTVENTVTGTVSVCDAEGNHCWFVVPATLPESAKVNEDTKLVWNSFINFFREGGINAEDLYESIRSICSVNMPMSSESVSVESIASEPVSVSPVSVSPVSLESIASEPESVSVTPESSELLPESVTTESVTPESVTPVSVVTTTESNTSAEETPSIIQETTLGGKRRKYKY